MHRSRTGQIPHFEFPVSLIIPDAIAERSCIRGTFKRIFPFLIRCKYRISFVKHCFVRDTLHICFCNEKIIDKQLASEINRDNSRFVFNIRQRHFTTNAIIHHTRRPKLRKNYSIMQSFAIAFYRTIVLRRDTTRKKSSAYQIISYFHVIFILITNLDYS